MPTFAKSYSGYSCTISVTGADVSANVGGATVFTETCVKGGMSPGDVIRAADDAVKMVAAQMKAASDVKEVSAEAKAEAILVGNRGYTVV